MMGNSTKTKPNYIYRFFSIGLLILSSYPAFAIDISQANVVLTTNESKEIDDYLTDYRSGIQIIKTALDPKGKTISCVDILHQPGFNASFRYDHIQLQPSPELAAILPGTLKQDDVTSICPKGSVEMRLPSREALVKAGSLKKFLSKYHDNSQSGVVSKAGITPKPAISGHEVALYGQTVNAIAAQATFNTWTPAVQSGGEMSLSQLWIAGGSGSETQTVEAGYQVLPNQYNGDTHPHFFIYYTADNYNATGCYNLDCPIATRFVKTSNIIDIGGIVASSTVGGTQVEGTVAFYRDPATGNWILFYVDTAGNLTQSGYYKAANFGQGQLSRNGTFVEFGGEIYTSGGVTHTTTDMGSGQFSSAGYSNAAYQRNLKYMNLSGVIQNVTNPWNFVTNSGCYSLTAGTNASWETSFYFGGPGYSASCP